MQITDLASGTVYTFPVATQLQWNVQVNMTTMPIPLQTVPLLLNFGGEQPTIVITFVVTDATSSTGTAKGDFALLVSTFSSGSTEAGYSLDIPEVGQLGIQGFVYQMQITYAGGTVDKYDCSMTFYIGTII
jgi:hypothetical protein